MEPSNTNNFVTIKIDVTERSKSSGVWNYGHSNFVLIYTLSVYILLYSMIWDIIALHLYPSNT